jgi:hypothetical protein
MKSPCECGNEPSGSVKCCTTDGLSSSAHLVRVAWHRASG